MTMPAQKPGRSKQNYGTPQDFLAAARGRLGINAFSFDFACDLKNKKAKRGWTEKDNSLSKSAEQWAEQCYSDDLEGDTGKWGWLNPPFADIEPWVIKCLETSIAGGRIVFLVPASVGSNWYRDYIHDQFGVQTLFLNGRLCFIENWRTTINPATGKFYTSEPLYPKDCILVLFGTNEAYNADVWTWK